VLLFGSVAQGQAQPDSDIDLVAIFDDLDYTRRFSRQLDMQTAARACTGHRVQVHVTDWPEWLHRTRRVSASFEAGIAAEAQVLYARPATDVTWDKEIGLPADDIQEALGRLNDVSHLPDRYPKSMEANMDERRDGAVKMLSMESGL